MARTSTSLGYTPTPPHVGSYFLKWKLRSWAKFSSLSQAHKRPPEVRKHSKHQPYNNHDIMLARGTKPLFSEIDGIKS
jgi:hypothetical protein